jgi:hypothetical protein
MDTDFDPQDYTTIPLGLDHRPEGEDQVRTETNVSAFSLADTFQDDCLMTDAFEPRSEVDGESQHGLGPEGLSVSEFSTHLEGPLDYRFVASHMLILDNLPVVIPGRPAQAVSELLAILGGSAQNPIYGNEASQSSRYWEFMQTPQSIPPGQSSGVCPVPTYPPSRPNLTSQPGNPVGVVSIESRVWSPATISHNTQPPPPSCDHTNCNPPPNVGFLSRRFVENENWVRARACAVASLAHRRRGCKLLQTTVRPTSDSETDRGVVAKFTPYRLRS